MTLAVLLGESNSNLHMGHQLEFSDVEAPADAVSGGLLIAKPMAHAKPEKLWDPVAFRLRARAPLLEVTESRSLAIDEAVNPQSFVRNGNGNRCRRG